MRQPAVVVIEKLEKQIAFYKRLLSDVDKLPYPSDDVLYLAELIEEAEKDLETLKRGETPC